MKIKFLAIILISTFLLAFLNGCDDMLDVKSERTVDPDQFKYKDENGNIFALSGILSQLQKIADRYVFLGELRGDLMDITPNANIYLQQINNFNITSDNPYANSRDYYSVINNCNHVIHNIDTSVVSDGSKIMMQGFVAAKAFRAWTYMQIALNYGSAVWFDKPLLNIEDVYKTQTTYDIQELANILISDLLPYVNFEYSNHINESIIIPISFILGDLYLWTKQYDKAALQYRNLLVSNNITFEDYARWVVANGAFSDTIVKSINFYVPNFTSAIYTSTAYWVGSDLLDYSIHNYYVKPSSVAINNWDTEVYYHNDNISWITGDVRGFMLSYLSSAGDRAVMLNEGKSIKGADNLIKKYVNRFETAQKVRIDKIYIITPALVYLRYAEAVNRAGKPNLAFAVLKHGIKQTVIMNESIVPAKERENPLPLYMDFSKADFIDNIGIHAHGCGYPDKWVDYKIPQVEDTIQYVEDKIIHELALETAFDGNRFHDLMRIAIRRDDNSYLADKVSEKYPANKEYIRNLLLDRQNWFIK